MHPQISLSMGMHNRKVIHDDLLSDVYNWEEFEFLRSVVKEYSIPNMSFFLFLYGNFLSFLCKKTCQVSFPQRTTTCWVLNPRQKCWTKVSINISNWTVASASLCPLLACLPTCSHPCPTLPSPGDPLGFTRSSSSDTYITQPLLAVLVSWLRWSLLVGVPSFSFQISSPHMAQLRVMFTL